MLLKEIFAKQSQIDEVFDSRSTTNKPWNPPITTDSRLIYSREVTDKNNVRYNVYLNTINQELRKSREHNDIILVDIGFTVILPDGSETDALTGNHNATEVIGIVLNEALEKIASMPKLPDMISFTVRVLNDDGEFVAASKDRQRVYEGAARRLFPKLGYGSQPCGTFSNGRSSTTIYRQPGVHDNVVKFYAALIKKS